MCQDENPAELDISALQVLTMGRVRMHSSERGIVY